MATVGALSATTGTITLWLGTRCPYESIPTALMLRVNSPEGTATAKR